MKQKEFEENVIKNISECNSLNDLCNKLGLRGVQGYYDKLNEIIKKYNLDTSHFGTLIKSIPKTKMTDEEYFIKDSKREGKRTLYRLIHNLKWERKCQECGRTEWEGHPIPLEIHHKNGDHYDNRIENLEIICRNCHYYTDSFCKRKDSKIIDKELYCIECGKAINGTYGNKFCSQECFNAYKSKHLDEYKDNVRAACIESAKTRRKDFTKELIIDVLKKTKSFSEAGRMLNVSDNTIRKYCNKYDIPTHSNEMKAYIDKIG